MITAYERQNPAVWLEERKDYVVKNALNIFLMQTFYDKMQKTQIGKPI